MNKEHETRIVSELLEERANQHIKWGEQNLPFENYGSIRAAGQIASLEQARRNYELALSANDLTFLDIFNEELWEVIEAPTLKEQRKELVQLGAVVIQAIAALDRRMKNVG